MGKPGTTHHCPLKSKGNCRRANGICTKHQTKCTVHDKAHLKDEDCKYCAYAAQVAAQAQNWSRASCLKDIWTDRTMTRGPHFLALFIPYVIWITTRKQNVQGLLLLLNHEPITCNLDTISQTLELSHFTLTWTSPYIGVGCRFWSWLCTRSS